MPAGEVAMTLALLMLGLAVALTCSLDRGSTGTLSWTLGTSSTGTRLIAEKSPSLTPIEADVEPCRMPTPGASVHNGIRSLDGEPRH